MDKVFIFLVTGFEEIEALATIDILRRGDVNVKSVSLTDKLQVTGGHGITVVADLLFDEVDYSVADLFILPGGTVKINEHEGLKQQIIELVEKGKLIAAICAAPMVLGGLGLLKDKQATAYPGFEQYLDGANFVEAPVIVDGNIITGRGPGMTFDFALKLVEKIQGKEKRDQVAKGLLLS